MKKTNLLLAVAALTAASCSDNTDITSPIDPSGKEMISFSLSDGTQTRAGFTGSETSLAMRIQSDEKGGTGKVYTRTVAKAAVDGTKDATSYSTVSFDGAYKRYWDDAHGRKSLLSVFAVAVPNGGSSIENNGYTLEELLAQGDASKDWGTSGTNTIAWQVNTSEQKKDASSATTPVNNIDQEDLVYSNNIQAGGKDGIYRDYSDGNGYVPSLTGDVTHKNGQMLFFQPTMDDANAATTTVTDAPGHFDKGHLVFNHALSRMTITLVEGKGFDKTSANKASDFNFANGTNIKLLDMNVKGTLDIPTGKWTIPSKAEGGVANINKIAQTETGTYSADYATEAFRNSKYITLTSQMLPDYELNDGDNTNVMQFTIDGNEYFITQDMLFDALAATATNKIAAYGYDMTNENKFTMMQGKNYQFTITVNKTEIQALTATLADWTEVKGEYSINNSHITVTTQKINGSGDKACRDFYFYRWGEKLGKIYTDDSYTANQYSGDYKKNKHATLTETASNSNIWNTNWFYESNDTAYHFRTLNAVAAGKNGSDVVDDSNITNTGTPSISSFKMVSGPQDEDHDYHWGAPMKTGMDVANFLKYSETEGFKSSLHQGIVSPKNDQNNTINITELHMMSNINIRLITDSIVDPENAEKFKPAPSAVNLEDAQITLTRFAKTAKVDMGIGLITETYTAPSSGTTHLLEGDDDCAKITAPLFTGTCWWTDSKCYKTSTDWFRYSVVPQPLRRGTGATEADCVGITIRTKDNNEYYVIKDLADIIATEVSNTRNQAKDAKILRWFPGHTYNYTIRITKKGIEAITCTVADWVNVTAKQIDITLEN